MLKETIDGICRIHLCIFSNHCVCVDTLIHLMVIVDSHRGKQFSNCGLVPKQRSKQIQLHHLFLPCVQRRRDMVWHVTCSVLLKQLSSPKGQTHAKSPARVAPDMQVIGARSTPNQNFHCWNDSHDSHDSFVFLVRA